jgi:hypothetical protein
MRLTAKLSWCLLMTAVVMVDDVTRVGVVNICYCFYSL